MAEEVSESKPVPEWMQSLLAEILGAPADKRIFLLMPRTWGHPAWWVDPSPERADG